MITLKSLQFKNFLSVGAVTQNVDLTKRDLTLVIGENMDLGGNGSRNGVGKTALLQGISYALFGLPINNIKRDNLINKTNERGMVVSIDFTVRGVDYRIVRGRKPNVLKFWVNNTEQSVSVDDSQGDSRETQGEINRLLGLNADIFQHIVGLNSYTTPFLSLKVSDQRAIIEQLLGITLLSEKAESIKQLNKSVKEQIDAETVTVKSREAANKQIEEQILNLQRRQKLWIAKRDEDLAELATQYQLLSAIDIEVEIAGHHRLSLWVAQRDLRDRLAALQTRHNLWHESLQRDIATQGAVVTNLELIDIEAELTAHSQLEAHNVAVRDHREWAVAVTSATAAIEREQIKISELTGAVNSLLEHKCWACGSSIHDDAHATTLDTKQRELAAAVEAHRLSSTTLEALKSQPVVVPQKPHVHYSTLAQAVKHSSGLDGARTRLAELVAQTSPYSEQIDELLPQCAGELPPRPRCHYDTLEQAVSHRNTVDELVRRIEARSSEVDPYSEQIEQMRREGVLPVDYTQLNNLSVLLKHQEYLLDLLTNKKSFVRKRIIQANLGFLNSRLSSYLDRLGLSHRVQFEDDLSVTITELGRDLDFDNLSRGERTRLILALSLSMREVYSNLYCPINLLFVDELLDNGLDTVGVENAIGLFKGMSRTNGTSVFLVSHREELMSRVGSLLRVVKEGGFTSFEWAEE